MNSVKGMRYVSLSETLRRLALVVSVIEDERLQSRQNDFRFHPAKLLALR